MIKSCGEKQSRKWWEGNEEGRGISEVTIQITMAPLISPLSKDLKEGREVTHAFLGKRIPGRCQVPKSWGSYVSGCHSSWNRMARVGSSGSLVEMTMKPDPAGARNGFLCIFLWGRWRTTGGFEQRRLQSKKIMAQDEALGPLLLSPLSHNWLF